MVVFENIESVFFFASFEFEMQAFIFENISLNLKYHLFSLREKRFYIILYKGIKTQFFDIG